MVLGELPGAGPGHDDGVGAINVSWSVVGGFADRRRVGKISKQGTTLASMICGSA